MSEYESFMDGCKEDYINNLDAKTITEALAQSSHIDVDVLYDLIAIEIKRHNSNLPLTKETQAFKDARDQELGRLFREFIEDCYLDICDYKFNHDRRDV